jgi:hypothetical protein
MPLDYHSQKMSSITPSNFFRNQFLCYRVITRTISLQNNSKRGKSSKYKSNIKKKENFFQADPPSSGELVAAT